MTEGVCTKGIEQDASQEPGSESEEPAKEEEKANAGLSIFGRLEAYFERLALHEVVEAFFIRLAERTGVPPTLVSFFIFFCLPPSMCFIYLHMRFWHSLGEKGEIVELTVDGDLIYPFLVAAGAVLIGFRAGAFATRFNGSIIRFLDWAKSKPKPKHRVMEAEKDNEAKKEE